MTTPTWRRGCMKRNLRKIPPNIWVFFFGIWFQPTSSLRPNQDAGTHSGDATLLLPSQRLHLETHRRVMHIAAQLPEPWVVRHTKRNVLKFVGNKNPFATWKRIWNQDGNWAFFVACFFCSFTSKQLEHHHFFCPQRCKALNISGPFNVQFMSQASFPPGFPPVFPFPAMPGRLQQLGACGEGDRVQCPSFPNGATEWGAESGENQIWLEKKGG